MSVFSVFLKGFLYIILFLLALLIVLGLVLVLDWPLWLAVFLFLGLIGLTIFFILLRKIWLKRREKQFVQQVIDQDELYLKGLAQKDKDQLQQLQKRWKEAIETLKGSKLKKYGNPLYILPWYMVIGESGSGKTTAINSAHLSSPFAEISQISGISGTRNFDWWFFEQAIILDTAGRYSIPVDEGRDKEEWQKFINLLVKYRKKEPLNGIIITIAANKLLEGRVDVLEQDGRSIRRRILELMRVLGAKPPIYILVTKCDLIQGMTQFCNGLPEKSLNQAMGVINKILSKDAHEFLKETMSKIFDRLRDFRLLLLQQSDTTGLDPGLLLFPEEFGNLKKGLEFFFKGAFLESIYQETLPLRGIFFSSGHQEGSPYSHFLQALGLIQEKEVLQGTSKGLFLHDFFGKILPKDRYLFAPTQIAIEWKRLTKNLALTAWITIVLAICGLLSFSFVKNMHILREVSHDFPKPPVLTKNVLIDMSTMGRFNQTILKVEKLNRNWWIPRFGLNASKEVEINLKKLYFNQFRRGFLADLDKKMAERMAMIDNTTDEYVIGQYVTHLIRRINLLKACIEGEDIEALKEKPQPTFDPLMLADTKDSFTEIDAEFGNLYLYYLIWRLDFGEINQDLNELHSWLKHILTLEDMSLHWLVTWANNQEPVKKVTLDEFWEGSLSLKDRFEIIPAFTSKGKELIDSFLGEIESALPDPGPPIIAKQRLEFDNWYRKEFFEAWHKLGNNFSKGIEKLKGQEEWKYTASRMPTEDGAYFSLLNTMAEEFQVLLEDEDKEVPLWVELLYRFQDINVQAEEEKPIKDSKILERASRKIKSKIRGAIQRKTKGLVILDMQAKERASNAFLEYKNALADLATISSSKNLSYQNAFQIFKEEADSDKISFFKAKKAILDLKNSIGAGGSEDKMFWDIVEGPLFYLWIIIRNEASCYLQEKWDEEVLAEISGLSDNEALYELLKDNGYAWKFVKGVAKPFISWGRRSGYYAAKASGAAIPFQDYFFSFLNKGTGIQHVANQSYRVTIEAKPTSVNPGALIVPEATHLELRCLEGTQRLDNYQFPVKETFEWSSKGCEEVILRIRIGDIVLTKKYTGNNAFPIFLSNFRGGKHTFSIGSKEFRDYESRLEGLGIKYIDIEYIFTGHQPVLEFLKAPSELPRNIVKCWEF